MHPFLVALVSMLGADDYRVRHTATVVLEATPEARPVLMATMWGNAETMVRGEKLLREWDYASEPHPKAGMRYRAKHRTICSAHHWTVDVASISDGYAYVDAYNEGVPYSFGPWMHITDWDWEAVTPLEVKHDQ